MKGKIITAFTHREDGGVQNIIVSMLLLFTVIVVTIAAVKSAMIKGSYRGMEKNVKSALKDSAVYAVDCKQAARDVSVSLTDDDLTDASCVFRKNLSDNMKLTRTMAEDDYAKSSYVGTAEDNEIICNDVRVKRFTAYVLNGDGTVVTKKDLSASGGTVHSEDIPAAEAKTPDGIPVRNSLLWADIEFEVKGYFGATAKTDITMSCALALNDGDYGGIFDEPVLNDTKDYFKDNGPL